jgi:ABC-2 type transport system permease protein
MKTRLWASLKKETLILLRDEIGLSILFIMPMILILVMTLIQDSAFRTLNEKGIPIVFVDNDKDTLGLSIYKGLQDYALCSLTDSIDGKPATAQTAKEAVASGRFLMGIVIPAGASKAIRKSVADMVEETFAIEPILASSASIKVDSVTILLFIDPVVKESFIVTITSNLREFISSVKAQIMYQAFSQEIEAILPSDTKPPKNAFAKTQIINYKEEYGSDLIGEIVPNAVQHNVPAWSIFAMFFIVVPLVGSIMKEKKEGSAFRLHTIPSPYLLLNTGKILIYVVVCLLQFILMLTVGLFIIPMFGLPPLQLGNSIPALFIMALATAFAAAGYGLLVGTLAASEQQGAILGSLSILLLSALGGIWVPTYIMPEIMRNLSNLSPLNWALEGFYKLFIRGSGISEILVPSLQLILFFIATLGVSSAIHRWKRQR